MPLSGKSEFTIGRISKGQVMYPDVDLTDMNGFEKGVSRIHASINIKKSSVFITDLGSSNGTRINGERIAPHSPHVIENGDKVAFGKLWIEAVVRR
jgi:pSer/pThr/pTyr-binding forkhead associated (FHA) protein